MISVDEDLVEHLTQDETCRLDLDFEEWDVAGLPWWFLGNLRNNYIPRSNGSTDLQTNQVKVKSVLFCAVLFLLTLTVLHPQLNMYTALLYVYEYDADVSKFHNELIYISGGHSY